MQRGILEGPQPQVNGKEKDRNATKRIEGNAGQR